MHITFTTSDASLRDKIQALAEGRFRSLERVLANRSETAQLVLEAQEEAKQVKGNPLLFRVSGTLTVEGGKQVHHASAVADTLALALDRVRDDLVREVTKSRKKSLHLVRRGGAAVKAFLRFGKPTR